MIPNLPPPSICVIDDEEKEYRPILTALLRLGLGCVHVSGAVENLPPKPFKGLRIVFTDLHLSTTVGKDAASYTANVFAHVVAPDTSPLVVVIWSKYRDDKFPDDGSAPPDEGPNEADRFRYELLNAVEDFRGRLIFLEMPKPKEKPEDERWIQQIQEEIRKMLSNLQGFHALWAWESLVREAGMNVSARLAKLALLGNADLSDSASNENLMLILRVLAQQQGGPDCSAQTATRHLTTALSPLLIDSLEHPKNLDLLVDHGEWLNQPKEDLRTEKIRKFALHINGLLLMTGSPKDAGPFVPGTIYNIKDPKGFEQAFGRPIEDLIRFCYDPNKPKEGEKFEQWTKSLNPVFVEISPACDFHQGKRRSALLIAGLLLPISERSKTNKAEVIQSLPPFVNEGQDVFLVFCSTYKLTLPDTHEPDWLSRWGRLRELPLASLRNGHSGHASRVGFLSL